MKKLITLIAAIFVVVGLGAENRLGIIGGLNFPNQTKFNNVASTTPVGWNAGLTYQLSLGMGFCIQPELMFDRQTGSGYSEESECFVDYRSDSLRLPLDIQWGPDLGLFRPFVELSPYVSYSLANAFQGSNFTSIYDNFNNVDRLSYGLGIGFGFDFWKLQVKARYSWNLATQNTLDELSVGSVVSSIATNSCDGFSISLVLFFL